MRFLMNTPSDVFTERIVGIVDWLTQRRWQSHPDTLHAEIYQMKKVLSNAPTRPTRAVRQSRNESVEPVTEQQKIMDMAG
jgi:hypothetical protein